MEEAYRLYREGRELMEAGQPRQAVERLRRSAALSPHIRTLELLGECLIRLGSLREDAAPLAAATTLSDSPRAPPLLAEALFSLGQREDAIRLARLTLTRAPTNRKALGVLKLAGAKADRP